MKTLSLSEAMSNSTSPAFSEVFTYNEVKAAYPNHKFGLLPGKNKEGEDKLYVVCKVGNDMHFMPTGKSVKTAIDSGLTIKDLAYGVNADGVGFWHNPNGGITWE